MLAQIPPWTTHAISWTQDYAAAVQALSAVVVAILTVFLVISTRRYVKGTEKALTISSDQLQLLCEQVEDQKQALQLSREQHERDALENHREHLNTKVLEPLQHTLQSYKEPTFATNWSTQQYRVNVLAEENPVVAGPILVISDLDISEQDPPDTALLEDMKQHHRILMSDWENFRKSWYDHRAERRKWIEEMAQCILSESGLLSHGSKFRDQYVMDLRLAIFVYERLMRRGSSSLKIDETAYKFPVLSDGGTSYATGLSEQIKKLLDTKLEDGRKALSRRFSFAIATKTLPEKCPLVSLH
jgi:hypothetical protein